MDLSPLFKKKKQTIEGGSALGAQTSVEGPVVTRIAPSPTGYLHVGTARSALFNFLYAKKHGGVFIVRIEDTDQSRSKPEYEEDIMEGLSWLQIIPDQTYRQSERTDIYQTYISQLLKNGAAFVSPEESAKEPGKQVEVIRLRNQYTTIHIHDTLRGDVSFDTTELGDFVIAHSATRPLYHLAVVIDDYEMRVSHVIRGEDHISNTPRQILIQQALGFPRPSYTHIPLILSRDRSKMSKREGGVTIRELKDEGYLPEALVNYLALLGWNPGHAKEIFSLDELVREFDLGKMQRGGAIFDKEKLNWFNRHYVKGISDKKFGTTAKGAIPEHIRNLPLFSEDILERLIPVLKEKIHSFNDISRMAEGGELDYYFKRPAYRAEELIWKGKGGESEDLSTIEIYFKEIHARLKLIPTKSFTEESVKRALWDYAEEKGRGNVLWPMRFALSGREKSPDPFTLAFIFGKQETLARIEQALLRVAEEL